MKILKILGLVTGIHALAFILIFSIPGCSSTTKSAEAASGPPAASVAAAAAPGTPPADPPPGAAAPILPVTPGSNDVAASAPVGSAGGAGAFYPPTRPNSLEATQLQPVQAPADVTPAATYTVKSGDSLWIIAHRNHLKISELETANHLRRGAALHVGQRLIIPGKAEEKSSAAAPVAAAPIDAGLAPSAKSSAATKYTVKSGDRLGSIARRFGLTTGDLAAANNITDPARIRPGQELIIPAGGHAKGSHKSHAASHPAESSAETAHTEAAPSSNIPTLEPAAPPQIESVSAAPSSSAPSSSSSVPIIKIGGDTSAPSSQ